MSCFDALYKKLLPEQAVESPAHREGLKPHISMIGNIVKRQRVTDQPNVINGIMQEITNPSNNSALLKYGSELPDLVKKISSYISQQPTEHKSDIIERIRQSVTHPK